MLADFKIGFKKLWQSVQAPVFNYSSRQPYSSSCQVWRGIAAAQGPTYRGVRHLDGLSVCSGDRKEQTVGQWMLTWVPGLVRILKTAQTSVSY